MTNILNIPERKRPQRERIEAEAREWVIALDRDEVPAETGEALHNWLGRSPLHRQAFRAAAAAWGELDRWSEFLYAAPDSAAQPAPARPRYFRVVRPPHALAVGSLMAFVAAIGFGLYLSSPVFGPNAVFEAEYSAAIGEVATVALPDGSTVSLNTDSRISVAYSGNTRAVHLGAGEAFFEIADDPAKPFVVYVSKYAVRAVGTAFSVQMLSGRVEVNVTDGRVEVAGLEPGPGDGTPADGKPRQGEVSRVPVVKGQQVILSEESDALELVQKLEPALISKELSWRNGLFIFDNDPLEAVISEINRYTEAKIVIADNSIRDLRFGGLFGIDDIPLILTTMERNFGLRATRVSSDLVYLSRQTAPPLTE